MNYLLDSHVFLWLANAPQELGADVASELVEPENSLWLSTASVWELGIKIRLGRLRLPDELALLVESSRARFGLRRVPIEDGDAYFAAGLPLHHRDPFDRMLIAQAVARNLTILTRDAHFKKYKASVRLV